MEKNIINLLQNLSSNNVKWPADIVKEERKLL